MPTPCQHKLIHTERLIKYMSTVIVKICADCGERLGTVDVKTLAE